MLVKNACEEVKLVDDVEVNLLDDVAVNPLFDLLETFVAVNEISVEVEEIPYDAQPHLLLHQGQQFLSLKVLFY